MNRDALLEQAGEKTRELADAYRELACVHEGEWRSRRDAWERAVNAPTVTERKRIAEDASLDMTVERAKIDGEIAALIVEIAHIDRLLAHGLYARGLAG